ncbi:unnamed protein product [Brachionus calyciflorus]|uniref:CUB domain-containing protein n=1 Tax=Brachionus calyciflorus TaxID=104777 RepID=A0A813P196_9BILA|nr:unnamed protein product [Brachionus calyciflorus]
MIFSWKYQTKCTRHYVTFSNHNEISNEYNSVIEDFERDIPIEHGDKIQNPNKLMHLKCPNINDFLFIGQTRYGVTSQSQTGDNCKPSQSDCSVTVDYIANQCNGLNSCDIQLDSQFLHSCKNNSDYITIAYECIPGSQKVDICSNDETFIIDSSLSKNSNKNSLSRFSSFYLTSPNYPNEYQNNLSNCTCKLEYVKIDSNSDSNLDDNSEMNLIFRNYEFDLEEKMDNDKCEKDLFRIKSDKSEQIVCGQYKNFKEFYSSGSKFSLELESDDMITRRGFLIKISTQPEIQCPYNSLKFSSNKCIKLFGSDENSFKLNWFEATKSCESLNGRLFTVNDFVDDLRVNSFLNEGLSYWSKKVNESKCYSKRANLWLEESCTEKNAFICEFDAVSPKKNEKINSITDNNGNRLIRVACGSSSSIFSSAFRQADSQTTTKKPIKSNSITNTQKPTSKIVRTSTRILPVITEKSMINIQDFEDMTSTYKIALKKETTEINNNNNKILSQDLVLIIAIACGVSIVLIAINIFCLWNYLSKKLKKYYEKDLDQQTYRSSTMNKSTNRTLTSSVDSYAKVPAFDLEHMSACESLSSSGSELGYNTNKPVIQQHYYETLSKQQQQQQQINQWNNYAEYNPINRIAHFDSVVMMPTATMTGPHYMTAVRTVPINPNIVLLKQIPQQQQQIKLDEQEQYSCVVYGELSPAPSNGSNQPLITFSSNSSGVSAI